MLDLLRRPLIWLAIDQKGELAGFAVAVQLPAGPVTLLEYLAVREPLRSQGIGTKLLTRIAADLDALDGTFGIVLEVEDPADVADPPLALRRVAFYERWDARPVTCASGYFMPDLTDVGRRLPMLLLWRPLAAGPRELQGPLLRDIVTTIYESEYPAAVDAGVLPELLASFACRGPMSDTEFFLALTTLLVVLATVVVYIVQAVQLTRQTKLSVAIGRGTLAQNITDQNQRITEKFLLYPELRPYFYESAPLPEDPHERTKALAIAEMYVDFMALTLNSDLLLPDADRALWRTYFQDLARSCPAIQTYWRTTRDWYEPAMWELLDHSIDPESD